MIITFEGIDGVGKTTQAHKLQEYLSTERRRNAYYTQEPGWDNLVSQLLRTMLMSSETTPRQKMFLLLADRAAHFDKWVSSILSNPVGPQNCIVVMDRGPDSLIAYQGFGQGLAPLPWLLEANLIAMGRRMPDITVLLDMEKPSDALKRVSKKDYYETLDLDFYNRVRNGYLEIAKAEEGRYIVIDGDQSIEKVHHDIIQGIVEKMQAKQNTTSPANIQ